MGKTIYLSNKEINAVLNVISTYRNVSAYFSDIDEEYHLYQKQLDDIENKLLKKIKKE